MLAPLQKKFTEHPRKAGESYCEHFHFAALTGARLVLCGSAALLHAVFPFWCETFVSDHLPAIAQTLETRRASCRASCKASCKAPCIARVQPAANPHKDCEA